jgi:hypothetical protein
MRLQVFEYFCNERILNSRDIPIVQAMLLEYIFGIEIRVARWFIFELKIPIRVHFVGP